MFGEDCAFSTLGEAQRGRILLRAVSIRATLLRCKSHRICISVCFISLPNLNRFWRVLFFKIMLQCRSKQHTYDDVVEKVAKKLGLEDPSKLRLTSHNCYSQQPKPQPIKYRGVERLSDMLGHYNQVVYHLNYTQLIALTLKWSSCDFCQRAEDTTHYLT